MLKRPVLLRESTLTLVSELFVFFLFLTMCVGVLPLVQVHAQSVELSIAVATQKGAYYYREPIEFTGSFVQNGQLVSNGTVGIAVYDPSSLPIAFRIAKTGPTTLSSLVKVIDIAPCNETGSTLTSLNLLQTLWVKFTLKNFDSIDHFQYTTIMIFDANGIPLATRLASSGSILAGASDQTIFYVLVVPVSAQPGNATIVACVFTGSPKDGGVPYGEEKKVNFEIKRNPEINYTTSPMTDPSAPAGSFASSLKLTNELKPGDYNVFVSARSTLTNGTQQSMLTIQNTTQFSIINAQMPPQAAFTYYPVDSFVNMSITFDASASTAEGYSVQIVRFEWDFGDGTPKVNKTTALTTHAYTVVNNYTVTLNITDSQGLWSHTSKIIVILPPAEPQVNAQMPPQAAFTYYPVDSYVNMSITFDASASTAEEYNVSIMSYTWDFDDGSPQWTHATPTVTHTYTGANNYTVTLNVTDSQGLWSGTSKIVAILPPAGPEANFIWYPATPKKNQQVTFDATSSALGWNGTDHPPMVDYIWDFGDGNVTSGDYLDKAVHMYVMEGNYTVKLNVTDASGFKGYISKIIMVKVSGILGDINGDGVVDIYDAIMLANAYNSQPNSPNWNPNADINNDNIVDIYDAIILANHYNQHYP